MTPQERESLAGSALYRVVQPHIEQLQTELAKLDTRQATVEEALLTLGTVLNHEDLEAVAQLIDDAVVQVLVGWPEDEEPEQGPNQAALDYDEDADDEGLIVP